MKPIFSILLLFLSMAANAQLGKDNQLPKTKEDSTAEKFISRLDQSDPMNWTNSVLIWHDNKLAAYRRGDSAWVFVDPDGTLQTLNKAYPYEPKPVTFEAQYCRNCALTWRDGYLINGQPYVIVNGRLKVAKWYRWQVSDDSRTNKN
jgi:hypothetical protein